MRLLRSPYLLCLLAFLLVCLAPLLGAQVSSVPARINRPVDDSSLRVLRGNIPGQARAQFDRGQADSATPLTGARIVLARSPQQQAALDQFMAQQLDKSSPNYNRWLTPEQFGTLYGPADSDIAAVVGWLQSHGLTVGSVPPGRTDVVFSGSVAQVEEAFHTAIHTFSDGGEQFLSNVSDPSIPAALAPVVQGVADLNTFKPHPSHAPGGSGRFDPETHRLVPVDTRRPGATPALTTGSAGNYSLYVVPADAATIYNTPNSLNAGFSSATAYNGSGVTIGIGGDAVIKSSTIVNYRNRFLGDSTAPTLTYCSASSPITCSTSSSGLGISNSDADEAYIDTELAGGLAPGATVHYYASQNLNNAISKAINDNKVDIFSLSFGACEMYLTTSTNQLINSYWQQAASQGIAVTVSTGDNGAAGCDSQNTVTTATTGLQVNGFASTPYNIAVGGTDYYALSGNFTTYADASGGNFYRTAKSYIPESTWNNSTTIDTALSKNEPFRGGTNGGNIVAGSGGVSSCSNNNNSGTAAGCKNGYAKPVWQRGTGVPSDGARDLPDVSLLAGNSFDSATWLVCTDDTTTAGSTTYSTDCISQSNNQFYFYGYGGTSTSAPAFAGILALVQQSQGGGRLGQAAKTLYDIFNSPYAPAVFHDTTVGNISVPCQSSPTLSPDCKKNTAGNYFLTGYDTGTGYDLATGIGSVDATQLIQHWNNAIGTTPTSVTVTPASSSILVSQSLSVALNVTSSSGTPSGTITLTGGGYTSAATTLSGGAATITIPSGKLKIGTDTLTATYSGDTTNSGSTGNASVTVSQASLLTPTVTVTPAAATVASTQSLNVSVSVAGSGAAPTGTIVLTSGSYTSAPAPLTSGKAAVSIPANTLAAGANTLTATYSGDSTYNSASGTASVQVTVTAPPVFSLKASTPAAISKGGTATSTIAVSSTTGYAGSVALSCALTSSPAGATSLPACSLTNSPVALSTSSASGSATATVTTTAASTSQQSSSLSRASGSGALLAFFVILGIPRRKSWRRIFGVFSLFTLLGFISACGGGSGSKSTPPPVPPPTANPGTTAGAYTFTVTGTGSPALNAPSTTTFTVTVN